MRAITDALVNRFAHATLVVIGRLSSAGKTAGRTLDLLLDQVDSPHLGVVFNRASRRSRFGYTCVTDGPRRALLKRTATLVSR